MCRINSPARILASTISQILFVTIIIVLTLIAVEFTNISRKWIKSISLIVCLVILFFLYMGFWTIGDRNKKDHVPKVTWLVNFLLILIEVVRIFTLRKHYFSSFRSMLDLASLIVCLIVNSFNENTVLPTLHSLTIILNYFIFVSHLDKTFIGVCVNVFFRTLIKSLRVTPIFAILIMGFSFTYSSRSVVVDSYDNSILKNEGKPLQRYNEFSSLSASDIRENNKISTINYLLLVAFMHTMSVIM
jgi:hypothetical protein